MLSFRGVVMAPVDDDIPMLGHRAAKLDLEKLTAPVTGLRPVDDNATTGNSRTEFFETLHLRSDLGSDLFRWRCHGASGWPYSRQPVSQADDENQLCRIPFPALKEAAAEIRSVAKSDPVDGVVSLMERIWPAFQGIDTSSGTLGAAVFRTVSELIPILTVASADHATSSLSDSGFTRAGAGDLGALKRFAAWDRLKVRLRGGI